MNTSTINIRSDVITQRPAGINIHARQIPRLIVLVLNMDFDENELSRRIWHLAISTHTNVLLLGLCPDSLDHMLFRRQLVTVAAAIRDNSVAVDIQVINGNSWDEVEKNWQEGDLIVGLADKHGRIDSKIMGEVHHSQSQMPIYMITNIHPVMKNKQQILSQITLWFGTTGIIASFFWIQVQISRLPENWGQSALLIFSVFIELLILLVWDSITR